MRVNLPKKQKEPKVSEIFVLKSSKNIDLKNAITNLDEINKDEIKEIVSENKIDTDVVSKKEINAKIIYKDLSETRFKLLVNVVDDEKIEENEKNFLNNVENIFKKDIFYSKYDKDKKLLNLTVLDKTKSVDNMSNNFINDLTSLFSENNITGFKVNDEDKRNLLEIKNKDNENFLNALRTIILKDFTNALNKKNIDVKNLGDFIGNEVKFTVFIGKENSILEKECTVTIKFVNKLSDIFAVLYDEKIIEEEKNVKIESAKFFENGKNKNVNDVMYEFSGFLDNTITKNSDGSLSIEVKGKSSKTEKVFVKVVLNSDGSLNVEIPKNVKSSQEIKIPIKVIYKDTSFSIVFVKVTIKEKEIKESEKDKITIDDIIKEKGEDITKEDIENSIKTEYKGENRPLINIKGNLPNKDILGEFEVELELVYKDNSKKIIKLKVIFKKNIKNKNGLDNIDGDKIKTDIIKPDIAKDIAKMFEKKKESKKENSKKKYSKKDNSLKINPSIEDGSKIISNKIEVKFLEGEDKVFDKGKDKVLKFKLSPEVKDFVDCYLDGKVIDKSMYTVTNGSTVITFNDHFKNSLKEGIHEILFKFKQGTVKTTLLIKNTTVENEKKKDLKKKDSKNAKMPKTAVASGSVFVVAFSLIGCVFSKKRR